MQNNPTLSFDANEPLHNADFDELANATNFTRVFVGRLSNTSSQSMGFNDNRIGYGVWYRTGYDRVYLKNNPEPNANYFNSVASKGVSTSDPFIVTQYLDTNERNYTNSEKAYVERLME